MVVSISGRVIWRLKEARYVGQFGTKGMRPPFTPLPSSCGGNASSKLGFSNEEGFRSSGGESESGGLQESIEGKEEWE